MEYWSEKKLSCIAPGIRIGVQCRPGLASGSGIVFGVDTGFRWDVGLGIGVKLSDRRLVFDVVSLDIVWSCSRFGVGRSIVVFRDCWPRCCSFSGFGIVCGIVVLFGVSARRGVVVVPRHWTRRFFLSGFGVVPVVMVWIGVGVWRRSRRQDTALVWCQAWRRGTPRVVVFALRQGAASGTALGFGVGVWLAFVVRRWGFSWRWGSVPGFLLGFGARVRLGVLIQHQGLSRLWGRHQGLVSVSAAG